MSGPQAGLACPEQQDARSLSVATSGTASQGQQSSFLPQQNAHYLDAQYWDKRFQQVRPVCSEKVLCTVSFFAQCLLLEASSCLLVLSIVTE